MGIEAAIGGSALLGAFSSSQAAGAQADAANAQMAVQKQMYDQTREDLSPYREAGIPALGAVNYLLGLGSAPIIGGTAPTIETVTTGGTGTGTGTAGGYRRFEHPGGGDGGASAAQPETAGTTQYRVNGQLFNTMDEAQAYANANQTGGTAYSWEGSPGYQWQLQQGQQAIDNSAASGGGLFSGATLKAQQTYGTGLANQDYYNNLNSLMGVTNLGQNAAAQTGQAAQNYATGASNSLANLGNAQAAGYTGMANSLNSGLNNYLGYQTMQSALSRLPVTNGTAGVGVW